MVRVGGAVCGWGGDWRWVGWAGTASQCGCTGVVSPSNRRRPAPGWPLLPWYLSLRFRSLPRLRRIMGSTPPLPPEALEPPYAAAAEEVAGEGGMRIRARVRVGVGGRGGEEGEQYASERAGGCHTCSRWLDRSDGRLRHCQWVPVQASLCPRPAARSPPLPPRPSVRPLSRLPPPSPPSVACGLSARYPMPCSGLQPLVKAPGLLLPPVQLRCASGAAGGVWALGEDRQPSTKATKTGFDRMRGCGTSACPVRSGGAGETQQTPLSAPPPRTQTPGRRGRARPRHPLTCSPEPSSCVETAHPRPPPHRRRPARACAGARRGSRRSSPCKPGA